MTPSGSRCFACQHAVIVKSKGISAPQRLVLELCDRRAIEAKVTYWCLGPLEDR